MDLKLGRPKFYFDLVLPALSVVLSISPLILLIADPLSLFPPNLFLFLLQFLLLFSVLFLFSYF